VAVEKELDVFCPAAMMSSSLLRSEMGCEIYLV
jgi:hypothetical protein